MVVQTTELIKTFDGETNAVDKVSITIEEGKVCALVGESGSGKTTLLRLIAGLEKPSSGSIEIYGERAADHSIFISPEKRKIGFVFQSYALFPHLTVAENIAFGLSKKMDKKGIVAQMLALVGLEDYGDRYPHQLSGGQQQRVAMARALAPSPKLLLLDEPFSNLDTHLKMEMRNEVFRIVKATGVTAIFVTHDIQDAMAVADQIIILQGGRLLQQGMPKELYDKPYSAAVAQLFGTINHLTDRQCEILGITLERAKVGVRANHFQLTANPHIGAQMVEVVKQVFLGNYIAFQVKLGDSTLEVHHYGEYMEKTDSVYISLKK